jgi:hypothetical protein
MQESILFFRPQSVNWPVLSGFLITQASNMLYYFPSVTANGLNRVYVGHHLLPVKTVRRLKKYLFAVLSS